MRKFAACLLALLTASALLTSCTEKENIPVTDETENISQEEQQLMEPRNEYSQYNNYRRPLYNTYKKLTENKMLRVTYFGGSVTSGHGSSDREKYSWRALTGEWFDDNFPKANVIKVNRALGESGTYLGAHRVQMDVIAPKPDLIFLEYSINDKYYGSSYEKAASQYETIVREIKQALPDTDIITILVTDKSAMEYNKQGKLHPQAQAHEDIAAIYNIPTIHVGRVLADKVNYSAEEFTPKYAIDIVHLTDEGNKVYYDCIEEFLHNSLLATDFSDYTPEKQELPPVVSEKLFDGDRTHIQPTAELLEQSESMGGVGVTHSPDAYASGSSFARGVYVLDDPEDVLVLKFTGTEMAFWSNYYKEDVYYMSLDGGDYKKQCGSSHAPAIIVEDLEPGEHTVKVKIASAEKAWKIGSVYTRDESKATVKGTK